MTCGWCHREPAQHTLSTSGPTRCQYQTHRYDCPGTFSTRCEDQIINGVVAPAEEEDISGNNIKNEKDATIRQLEEELAKLRVSATPASSAATPSQPQAPPPLGTASQQSWGQATPSSLGSDFEALARDHLAKNQQFLQSGAGQQGSYTGPLMSEIRKDPNVQLQANAFIEALKQNVPVFANTNPSLAGINPLSTQFTTPSQALPGMSPAVTTPASTTVSASSSGIPITTPQAQENQSLHLLIQSLLSSTPQPVHSGLLGQGAPAGGNLVTGPAGGQLGAAFGQFGPGPQLGAAGYVPGNAGMGLLPQYPPQQPHSVQQQLLALLQPQAWPGYVPPPQPPQTPQISPSILSALSQLPPDAAAAALRNLQLMPNVPQVQNPGLSLPGLGAQPQHQFLGAPLQQSHVLGSQLPLQGLLQYGLPQVQPQKPSPAIQGMSSMTGVTHVRPTEYSKHCTVEYAKKVKADSCNAVLYIWGYVAQLLLSRQGLLTRMSEQEQNGRLQHLLHILELCAMQSSSTEFNSQAWLCAKNYSDRVYQDLDSGATTWSSIGPKMHPTNLMQAMSSYPRAAVPFKEKKTFKDDAAASQPVCGKWSSCTTEDKCQYEVETGRQCNRPHYCTFCMKTFGQARRHKEVDCRKKEAAASSGSGSQPS